MPSASGGKQPEVTVVVVPRDKYHLATRTLDHLLDEHGAEVSVIYVDEARSPRRLRQQMARRAARDSRLRHLALPHRAGANECRARGFALVDTPYVLFLDNDAQLWPGSITALRDCAEATHASYVAPVYLHTDGRNHHAGGGVEITEGPHGRRLTEDHPFHGIPYEQAADELERRPIGAPELHGVLVRSSSLDAIGGLDANLRAAMDCLDLGLRLRDTDAGGWREPSAVVVYDDATPRPSDLRLHASRWARATVDADVDRFATTWQLDRADPRLAEHQAFLAARRRRPYRWVRGPFRRLLGDRALRPVDRLFDAVIDRATAGSRRTR